MQHAASRGHPTYICTKSIHNKATKFHVSRQPTASLLLGAAHSERHRSFFQVTSWESNPIVNSSTTKTKREQWLNKDLLKYTHDKKGFHALNKFTQFGEQ